VAETITIKCRAFLSYAHADSRRAKWLHGRLESFRFDKDLIDRHAGALIFDFCRAAS
jgi:hypothetical protein